MEQTNFSENNKTSKFDSFSREDFIKRQQLLEDENLRLVRELYELRQIQITDEQLKLITAEQISSEVLKIRVAFSQKWNRLLSDLSSDGLRSAE